MEPKTFKTNEIRVRSDIPDNYDGFKIIHISDIHYGRTVSKDMLEDIKGDISGNYRKLLVALIDKK